MNFEEVYHFLFDTYAGLGSLMAAGLVLSLLAAIIMERRTRKKFKRHEETSEGWDLFEEDSDEE